MSVLDKDKVACQVKPIGGRIGALVENVQLSGGLDREVVEVIRKAVLEHKVVFLRNQTGSSSDFEGFAELYGDPVGHPLATAPDGNRYVYEMNSTKEFRADHWHTDFSFLESFIDGGMLYPELLPTRGGDTCWSNTAAAYAELPEPLREMADRLWATHNSALPLTLLVPDVTEAGKANYREYNKGIGKATLHPVVRVHPETGERSLLLGNFVESFDGFPRTATNAIYELLHYYITRPENTIRWQWQMGDIAIFDNRSSQHYGVRDFAPEPRVMRRISFTASSPIGLDSALQSRAAAAQ